MLVSLAMLFAGELSTLLIPRDPHHPRVSSTQAWAAEKDAVAGREQDESVPA